MDFYVYCFPVCGGSFPCLLGLLVALCIARIKKHGKRGKRSYAPDLCLGSSGGSIVELIGVSANWDSDLIRFNASLLNSEMFVKRWVHKNISILPEMIFSLANRSLYDQGRGGFEYFQRIFTHESIISTETWIGTYNYDDKKTQFFCNKARGDSYINHIAFNGDQSLFSSKSLFFCDGDMETIFNASLASSSIPMIVPSKKIMNHTYGDGGVMYASPLSVFYKEIARIVNNVNEPTSACDIPETDENQQIILSDTHQESKNLRLMYFMGQQDLEDENENGFMIDTFISMIKASLIRDRNTSIELLELLSAKGTSNETFLDMSVDELADILDIYAKYKHYVICLFPHGNPKLSISNFDGNDVLDIIEHVLQNFGCHIWYSNDLI